MLNKMNLDLQLFKQNGIKNGKTWNTFDYYHMVLFISDQ